MLLFSFDSTDAELNRTKRIPTWLNKECAIHLAHRIAHTSCASIAHTFCTSNRVYILHINCVKCIEKSIKTINYFKQLYSRQLLKKLHKIMTYDHILIINRIIRCNYYLREILLKHPFFIRLFFSRIIIFHYSLFRNYEIF